jgi:hypothetical protein
MSDTTVFEREPPSAAGARPGRRNHVPVIRIPVTRSNQDHLKVLRARELEPWQKAGLCVEPDTEEAGYLSPPSSDREAQLILLVLAAAAAALMVQSTAAATAFVTQWERFRGLVDVILR